MFARGLRHVGGFRWSEDGVTWIRSRHLVGSKTVGVLLQRRQSGGPFEDRVLDHHQKVFFGIGLGQPSARAKRFGAANKLRATLRRQHDDWCAPQTVGVRKMSEYPDAIRTRHVDVTKDEREVFVLLDRTDPRVTVNRLTDQIARLPEIVAYTAPNRDRVVDNQNGLRG